LFTKGGGSISDDILWIYGVAADATNDYVRIGESTALESLRRFIIGVVQVFGRTLFAGNCTGRRGKGNAEHANSRMASDVGCPGIESGGRGTKSDQT
jgi:hypothetical protein